MASIDTPTHPPVDPMRSCTMTLTVPTAATSVSVTSSTKFRGKIQKIELDPGAAMATSATLKGYQADTTLLTATRDHFLNYTFPASEVELVFYPLKPATTNAGVAVEYASSYPVYVPYVVDGHLTVDLAAAVAGDSVIVKIFVGP